MSFPGLRTKKGAIWVSAVIYVLIGIIVLTVVIEAGLPLIGGLQDRSEVNTARNTFSAIDGQIKEVANEGQGSQRIISLEIPEGTVTTEDNKLRWKIETNSKVIEPRTRVELGNLIVSSDVDVSASNHPGHHVLQNSRILVNFSRFGSESNRTWINTSSLINHIRFKDTGSETNGTFTFFINQNASTTNGTGYTEIIQTGTGLASATLKATVNSSIYEYELHLTLDSKADFLRAEVENFKIR
jgi:type II secretory pathway pseudopilin PulG